MSELADSVTEAIEQSHESSGGSNLNGLVAISVAIVATFMALCNVKDGNIGQAMEEAQASGVDAWAYYQAKVRVYEKEKADIKQSAEDYKKEYERLNLHDDQFDMADALMSVAIALL